MWLLNATTRQLEYFIGSDVPKYAILSHRWEDEEVSFDDIHNNPERLKGYRKIDMCCRQALKHTNSYHVESPVPEPIQYVWVDTCCIDKRSSAELSEAINSMYDWYANAKICYAYLYDVQNVSELGSSEWFARGWTLQELLAPPIVLFFNVKWDELGVRNMTASNEYHHTEMRNLKPFIKRITKIPDAALEEFQRNQYSVAQRMSWVASRITTRPEDLAYCLLGIFEVNMPLLYGERYAAFQRLQEEIVRQSNDLSIFAWNGLPCKRNGMLAEQAHCFRDADIPETNQMHMLSTGFSIDNAGLEIQLVVERLVGNLFLAYLLDWGHATKKADQHKHGKLATFSCPSIYLTLDPETNVYRRVGIHGSSCRTQSVLFDPKISKTAAKCLRKIRISRSIEMKHYHKFRCLTFLPQKLRIAQIYVRAAQQDESGKLLLWDAITVGDGELFAFPVDSAFSARSRHQACFLILIQRRKGKTISSFIGFDDTCQPVCVQKRETEAVLHKIDGYSEDIPPPNVRKMLERCQSLPHNRDWTWHVEEACEYRATHGSLRRPLQVQPERSPLIEFEVRNDNLEIGFDDMFWS